MAAKAYLWPSSVKAEVSKQAYEVPPSEQAEYAPSGTRSCVPSGLTGPQPRTGPNPGAISLPKFPVQPQAGLHPSKYLVVRSMERYSWPMYTSCAAATETSSTSVAILEPAAIPLTLPIVPPWRQKLRCLLGLLLLGEVCEVVFGLGDPLLWAVVVATVDGVGVLTQLRPLFDWNPWGVTPLHSEFCNSFLPRERRGGSSSSV